MIKLNDLLKTIIIPTLSVHDSLSSESAIKLVAGTACQESECGFHLIQEGGGPALGIYQIEPDTAQDVIDNYLNRKLDFKDAWDGLTLGMHRDFIDDGFPYQNIDLIGNLYAATLMCRLIYYRIPETLPPPDDVEGLAGYWKQYYNTPAGKGTIQEFITKYHHFKVNERVADLLKDNT